MTRGRLVWGIAVVDVAVFLVTSIHPSDGGALAVVLYAVGLASFTAVGALLCTRVPENPIGVLLLGAGTVFVVAIVFGTYAEAGALQSPPWPGWELARVVGNILFIYPFAIAIIGIPLVFPDGRLVSQPFRWVVRIVVFGMVVWTVYSTLFDDKGLPQVPELAFLAPIAPVLQASFLVSVLIGFGAAVLSVSLRFRRGDPVQREQVKWLAADISLAAAFLTGSLLLTFVSPDLASNLSGLAIIATFALPVVIGIAILRYRLYEIDRLISRTIGWAAVTGLLVAVFAGLVVALQALLAGVTREDTLAVAASTLVAFALFQPLRRRVQRAVDRRFDRARYDGQRTVDAFAERLRAEMDIDAVLGDLSGTTGAAVAPIIVGVWIRPSGRAAAGG